MNHRIRLIAATGVTVAGLAMAPTVAMAAPDDVVPGTECTVAQVERATVVEAPEAIAVMNGTPGGREQAERILLTQPEEREAIIADLVASNPAAVEYYAANKNDIDAKLARIIATCATY